ncbi:hypothetical protein QIH87_14250 [Bradyrhizobium elkanii]|uniref:hypothetical protein n=1 Tax=Bradyrhizobium elkanii TaxID=29448 RepID=UPI002227EDF7|nr:hypothetical protein [Bradyrhizobium elkanii]MCW2112480.1 hypothetical protein [Bradyrhizobium elkanii]WLB12180.1 hypothetical protein QIH87_14250 [Bradyrhizobium elkanii]WLB70164.1 hypothetical protein QIH89_33555 [Bradyrhizobium elkanii]
MADDTVDVLSGTSEQPSTPSVRESIEAAVAQQREAPDTSAIEQPQQQVAEAAAATEKPPAEGRDEKGRFVAKPAAAPAQAEQGKDAAQQDAPAAAADQQHPKTAAPPTSWSPTAKAAFNELPQPVKDAIAKREDEVNNGFAKLAEYKPLDRWIEEAKKGGTDLATAVATYRGMELELQKDFVNGIALIAQRQGVSPLHLAQGIVARFGGGPSQNGQPGAQHQPHQQGPTVDPSIAARLDGLEKTFRNQQQATVNDEIERFASDPKHPYFHNVRETMGHLMNAGQATSMADAYEKACWANPEIRALLIKEQAAPAPAVKADDAVSRARAAAKATGGTPPVGLAAPTSLQIWRAPLFVTPSSLP